MSTDVTPAVATTERSMMLERAGQFLPTRRSRFNDTASAGFRRSVIDSLVRREWPLPGAAIVSLVAGRRAVGQASPVTGKAMMQAMGAACTRLGLRVHPDLLASLTLRVQRSGAGVDGRRSCCRSRSCGVGRLVWRVLP